MLYIVSGFMRSGTSMMMRALEAGGMKAAYSLRRDEEMNKRWGDADYLPNDSYYELDREDYQAGDLAGRFDGQLIKCLWGGLIRLPKAEYRVVFMRRSEEEIKLSLTAFFGRDATRRTKGLTQQLETVLEIIRDRKSFLTVDELWFKDVVARPHEAFSSLNWPIDVEAAAKIPDSVKARFNGT